MARCVKIPLLCNMHGFTKEAGVHMVAAGVLQWIDITPHYCEYDGLFPIKNLLSHLMT